MTQARPESSFFCWRIRTLVFSLSRPLNLLTVTIDGALILLDLLLIGLVLLLFLALHVISDERAGAESNRSADCRSSSRVTHGCANDAARRGSSHGSDSRAFFPGRHGTAGTGRENRRGENERRRLEQISPGH
jgi:hypothetical protein